MFVECQRDEATHVEILKDELGHYEKCSLTAGKIYKVEIDDAPGFEGDKMIRSDNGNCICNFSIVVDVKWVKEVEEEMLEVTVAETDDGKLEQAPESLLLPKEEKQKTTV